MAYTVINPSIFAAALSGASAAMGASNRVPVDANQLSAYHLAASTIANQWAQVYDTTWASSATPDEFEVEATIELSYGVWENRSPLDVRVTAWTGIIKALIATISAQETLLASLGIVLNLWGSGGGGAGLPAAPAAIGSLVEYSLAIPPLPALPFWDIVGGDNITSFTGITRTDEIGTSVASLSFTATANVAPISASVSWSGVASGSQVVAPGTSMSGTIVGPFVGNVSGNLLTVVLHCVFADGTKTATQVVTWSSAIAFGSSAAPGNDQTFYNTIRLSGNTVRLSPGGNYLFASGLGEDQVVIMPASYGTAWTMTLSAFIYTPVLYDTQTITENGVAVSMNFFTFADPGAHGNFTMNP